MTSKRVPKRRGKTQNTATTDGKLRQPSIHMIRIPSKPARERAFCVLIDLEEMWVRLPGGVFGTSSKQLAALNKHRISLELAAKMQTFAQRIDRARP